MYHKPYLIYALKNKSFDLSFVSHEYLLQHFEEYVKQWDEPFCLEYYWVAFVEERLVPQVDGEFDIDVIACEAAEEPYFMPGSLSEWLDFLTNVVNNDEKTGIFFCLGSDEVSNVFVCDGGEITAHDVARCTRTDIETPQKTFTDHELGRTRFAPDDHWNVFATYPIRLTDLEEHLQNSIRVQRQLIDLYTRHLQAQGAETDIRYALSELDEIVQRFRKIEARQK
ncbi:MAG: hypothetical protein CMJ46_16595 [Planctomyces sp.]|nr:hypothetical protein [Planctomyces sp.]